MLQLVKLASGTIVLAFFGVLTLTSYRYFEATGSVRSLGLVLVNTLFVALYLTRRREKAVSPAPLAWCLGFAGTLLPLLVRPGDNPFAALSLSGDLLQAAGLVSIGVALMSLRRSFGIVAAHRGIMTGGLYRFVRHPLYAGELLFFLGFALSNPSAWNLCLWGLELGVQVARARIEEGFLAVDPDYRQYRRRVRHRFIPGVL